MHDLYQVFLYIVIMLSVSAIAFLLGIKICLKTLALMDTDTFTELVQGLRDVDAEKEVLPKTVTRITLTASNDILLAYDAATGEFLAQGSNTKELLKAAFLRFPNKEFTVAVDKNEVEARS